MHISSHEIVKNCIPGRKRMDEALSTVLRDLYSKNELLDATISCCDGATVEVHKVILAAYSKYFRILLTGPMAEKGVDIKNINLNFSSETVRFFIDALYENVSNKKSNCIDIIEFTMLVDFLDICHPDIKTEGLRLAAWHLTPENCISELNEAISKESRIYPKWTQTIIYYILEQLQMNEMILDDNILNALSRDSLVSLLYSSYIKFVPIEGVCSLISKFLTFPEYQQQSFVEDQVLPLISWFTTCREFLVENNDKLETLSNIGKDLRSQYEIPELNKAMKQMDEEIVIKINEKFDSELSIGFVFYPSIGNIKPAEFREDYYFQFALEQLSIHASYYIYRNRLYAIDVSCKKDEIILLQYKVLRSEWKEVAKARLPIFVNNLNNDDEEFAVSIVSFFVNVQQAVVSLGLGHSWNQSYVIIFFNLHSCPPNIKKYNLKKSRIQKVLPNGDDLLLFKSPYVITTLENFFGIWEEKKIFEISHSKVDITFGTFVTYDGLTYHIYMYKNEEGIYVDEFDFEHMKWKEQSSKLSESHKLLDAFTANGNLFITYRKNREVDNNENEEQEDNIFIGECYCEEVGLTKYVKFKHSPDNPKVNSRYYSEKGKFIVAPRDCFPLINSGN